MKVALDAMGGDNAPQINIVGAVQALKSLKKLSHLYLVGDEKILKAEAAKHQLNLNDPRVSIVHAPEVIGMSEPGAKSVRRKKLSSNGSGQKRYRRGLRIRR
jgi:glycerol-3-phosphate acyltransferase PlsX